MKILIVDDSSSMRQILNNIVAKLDFSEIIEASGSMKAIQDYKEQKPDLVLLDLILPDIQGDEVLAEIKKINPQQKVIMITAVGQEEMMERCKALEATEYIVKPFDDGKVAATIKKVMNM